MSQGFSQRWFILLNSVTNVLSEEVHKKHPKNALRSFVSNPLSYLYSRLIYVLKYTAKEQIERW